LEIILAEQNFLKIKAALILIILASISIHAQDSLRSQAFREPERFNRSPVTKPQYSNYPLIAGYILQKDANSGDPFAMHELGIRYLIGAGFPSDTAKAFYWISRAAERNITSAMFNTGIMYSNGYGTGWNPFTAFEYFLGAAQAGMPEAMFALGIMYLDNLTVSRNLQKAYDLISQSAKSGFLPASETLKELKQRGILNLVDTTYTAQNSASNTGILNTGTMVMSPPVELDFLDLDSEEKEEKLSDTSLDSLFIDNLRLIDELGIYDSAISASSPAEIIALAESNGSPEALLIQALIYQSGYQKPKDNIKAAYYFFRSYRAGSGKALAGLMKLLASEEFRKELIKRSKTNEPLPKFLLASLTVYNLFVVSDNEASVNVLENLYASGYEPAGLELASIYYAGAAVEKNIDKAVELWRSLMNKGNKEAQINLSIHAVRFSINYLVIKEAVTGLLDASMLGSISALTVIGYCHEQGIYFDINKAKAERYYKKAAVRGYLQASDALKNLYDDLRPSDPRFEIFDN